MEGPYGYGNNHHAFRIVHFRQLHDGIIRFTNANFW